MSQQLDNAIQKMIDFGYTKDQINEIIDLSASDIIGQIMEDFVEVVTDESKLTEYETRLNEVKTQEERQAIIDEICNLTYGDQADAKKEEIIAAVLTVLLEDASKLRDVYGKYQQGDPETVRAVDEAKNSPDAQQLQQEAQALTGDNQ